MAASAAILTLPMPPLDPGRWIVRDRKFRRATMESFDLVYLLYAKDGYLFGEDAAGKEIRIPFTHAKNYRYIHE